MYRHYGFWLAIVSLACLVAERVAPWRKGQHLLRPQLAQDAFWFAFNGWFAATVFADVLLAMNRALGAGFAALSGGGPEALRIISRAPLAAQVAAALVIADFIEWLVHNALHRVGHLWKIHRVHHSIRVMDWIGNFRFHWMEILVYKTVKYLPVAVLGARWEAILIAAVVSTAIGNLNHSNLNISWGPLRYLLNSPRMHIWHHEKQLRGKAGVNFGIVFSVWDWLFGTAFMPREAKQPAELGFMGMERVASSLLWRFFLPTVDRRGAGAPPTPAP